MLIEKVEHLKEWLTNSLAPICEADAGALAKYVVALVKKDRPLNELKDTCVDQLDVFLQTKTKDFVETLFEALNNKTYIKPEEPKPVPVPDTTDSLPEFPPVADTENRQQTAGTPVEDELKPKEEENKEAVAVEEPRRKLSRSRSRSPRNSFRPREDDRRVTRRYDDRRPYDRDRGFPRRRSISPRDLRHRVTGRGRSRSPLRRRSPFRPIQRSRSPRMRGRGRGRSRSRSWSRSLSPPKRSWSRSRSRERFRSRSRSLPPRSKSRSPRREVRPPRIRSRSPLPRLRSRSPRPRSRSPRYWSPRKRSRSPGDRSPRSRSRTPFSRDGSRSPRRSRSLSPPRKVRRHSSNSRGPTPTEENGLADSTEVTGSSSNITVVTLSGGRFEDAPPTGSRLRCRDFDEKGFCVRGDLCMFDHGADPVIVEKYNVPPYPPGMHGTPGPPPGHPGGPPMGMNVPPPGFMPRMPGMVIRGPRPDFPQEPYNPEAPGITVPPPPAFWPGGPGIPPPHFLNRPPPPQVVKIPTRELVNVTEVKKEIKEEEEDEEPTSSSSSSRTVIAPKDDTPSSSTQPLPPGTQEPPSTTVKIEAISEQQAPVVPGYQAQQPYMRPYQRFHPYGGLRKPFDFNRIGGYRKPDQTNCTLEVRKVPKEHNNIAKLNEHFGKFGTLKNIQVSFEGDPEAALVTYSSNAEAAACYRSSEPVFNNRFIKVFWHNKEKQEATNSQEQAPTSTTTPTVPDDGNRQPAQTRLGPLPPASKMSLNNMVKKTPPVTPVPSSAATAAATAEKPVAYTSSMGTISKTVYNPAAIKAKAKTELASPTAVGAADFVSRMEAVKQHEIIKKEAALKKLEIQKSKQVLLEKQIEQQKVLIGKLEAKKDMGPEEKSLIMKVPYIALTKEEKEFLKSAHMDVEQEDEDFESDVEDGSLETTLIADPDLDTQTENTYAARNGYQESRDEVETLASHGEGDGHSRVTNQNQVSLTVIVEDGDHSERTYYHNGNNSEKGTTDYKWSPMSMPTLSPACMPADSIDENIEEQAQDVAEEESPVVSWENIQECNNVDLSQSVSEYYRDIYKRRFSDVGVDTNEKQTLKTLTDSIDTLKTELGRRVVVKKDAEGATIKSPEQAKKEILDVELELMTKSTNGEDTLELKKKLLDLQKIANSMGLLGRGRGRGAVGRGRASTTWVASGVAPPVVGRGRGRGALLGKASVAARTLDRRPKQVEVKGFTAEEKEEVALHLGKLDELENIDFKVDVPCAILTFNTRRDAELGILHGSKFKNKVLKMSWYIPKPELTRSSSHVSADSDLDTEGALDEIDEEALLAEEDDENDDTRSWRR